MSLGLFLLPSPVHAAGIIFKAKADNPNGFTPMTVGPLTVALGDALIVNVMSFGTGGSGTVTDSQGNVFTLAIQSITGQSSGATTGIFVALASASSSDTVTITRSSNNFVGAFLDYSGVGSFGQTGSQQLDSAGSSGVSQVTLSNVATTSWIFESFFYETAGTSGSSTANNGQILRDGMSTSVCATNGFGNCNSYDVPAPSSAPALSISYSSNSCAAPGCFASHSAVELIAGAPGPTQTVTSCFGNCGAPAITLVNTNSTHTVNFNQSITLFYEVQLSVTGFMLNVTTNLAKTYSTNFAAPFLGFYRAQCPVGVTPGSNACPFALIEAVGTGVFAKGRASMAGGSQFPVVAGDWIGIAVSAQISGLDLNDTNTNVALFQTSGFMPPLISQSTVFAATSKVGLWAWVQSTVITSLPPPSPLSGCTNNFAQLDCLLPALSNGSCRILTASCQTSGSLFWIIILTVLSFMLVTVGFASAHVTKFVAAGDVFLFFFLAWFFIFVGVNLVESFVVIFFLFIGATVFGKTARNYF